jgi:dolichyl-phosphate beta-glucosyltransferase
MASIRAVRVRDMPPKICLIVPCFNEAARLDLSSFSDLPANVTCLLVDDGSTDRTAEIIRTHESDRLRGLILPGNVGKAEAIRRGMLHAKNTGWLDDAVWVGYWDADLATPLSELDGFIRYAGLVEGRVDGILGSRISRLGSRIVRSYLRHLLGRAFATAAAALMKVESYDSQCGAKLFRVELVDEAFGEPFLSRWIFDVEILARLRARRLIEYPLVRWVDVGGSKVSVIRVAIPTLIDLIRIRRKYHV